MNFFLGTHQPHWLARLDVPLFVSRRRLEGRRSYPRALKGWALDSGGFSELSMHGHWTVGPKQYAEEVQLWSKEVGALRWAAVMDWMCEPFITSKTLPTTPHRLAVPWHQAMTIESLGELRALAPEQPWAPVLQGWELGDYLRHVEAYDKAGFDLRAEPIVGVGSVCRRQGTFEAEAIFRALAGLGLRLHGFGVKIDGLARYADVLESADSMAWSYAARRQPPLSGCTTHINCANCPRFALKWRQSVLDRVALRQSAPRQLDLWRAA